MWGPQTKFYLNAKYFYYHRQKIYDRNIIRKKKDASQQSVSVYIAVQMCICIFVELGSQSSTGN